MNHMSNTFKNGSRREFIAAATAATASLGLGLQSKSHGQVQASSPNDQITFGVIGYGGRCKYILPAMLQHQDVRCVAIADVQQSRQEECKTLVDDHYGDTNCRTYRDFREMLSRDDIDAIVIATGDRWHALATILAVKAGKDVYCEKPCGITIADCQELAQEVQANKRIFQAGTQRRSLSNYQAAVDLAHSGKLGNLQTLKASVYVPLLDNSWLPAEELPDQDSVDWNLWLGPAAWRPYNLQYVNGEWRGQWDFDSGARLLDWGAHTLDLCQWANQSDDTMPVEYEPADDSIVCTCANGVTYELQFLKEPFGDRSPKFITRLGTCPVRFVGDNGWVETGDSGEVVVSSEALRKELPPQTKRVRGLDVAEHSRNFFDCVHSRNPPRANESVMRHSHIACHAAAISWILGKKLTLDPHGETFANDDYANTFRSRPRREWDV